MTKVDRNMSELWQIVYKSINVTLVCLLDLLYELNRNYNLQIWKKSVNGTCTAARENNCSDASFNFNSVMICIFFSLNHHDKTLRLLKLSTLEF
jgi:hypothetical protein